MPFISRVIEREKTAEGMRVTVRITGLGDPDDSKSPMVNRAKARALFASGMLPRGKSGKKSTNEVGWFKGKDEKGNDFTAKGPKWSSEDYNVGFDEQMDEGPLKQVRKRIKAAKDAGVLARLDKTRKRTSGVKKEEVQEVFGRGFFNIVQTVDYTFTVENSYGSSKRF